MNAGSRTESVQHTLQLDRRKTARITGVMDVCSFHETEIVLKVDTGLMVLTGENLHIGKLLLEDGKLDVDGQIDGIVYEKGRHTPGRVWPWRRRDG